MLLRKDIQSFLKTLPKSVTLIAATKYSSPEEMKSFVDAGITNFGENRVESFLKKYQFLNKENITWHFIGHLQRNKTKLIINKIDYLHSLDSILLAEEIQKYRDKPLNVFVEISINEEKTKNGVFVEEIEDFIGKLLVFSKINLVGLMMMAKANIDENEAYFEFKKLTDLRDKLEHKFKIKIPYLSMGMSDDYLAAIKAGSTHIRLGRILLEK